MRPTRTHGPKPARGDRLSWLQASVLAIAIALFAFATQAAVTRATHSSSTIGLLAIDTSSEGNAATSLGPVNGCSRLEPGAETTIDYIVDSIPEDRPLIGFEAQLGYDPQLLEVADADYGLLLAAVGTHQPFSGQSDPLPDSDGSFRMQVLDTASMTDPEANVERGPGVLARVTFRAKAAGLASITITVSREPLVYPVVLDTQNELIFVDRIGNASLAIGQDCPVEAQQPVITELAELNEQIIADNPELAGGSHPAGGTSSPSASLTPKGQTASGETPTPAPSPTTVPCAAPERPTPGATPTPLSSSSEPPQTTTATPADITPPSPTATELVCTPTPTPIPDDILNVDEDSNTPLAFGAAALLTMGTAAAGSGWYLYRRSRGFGRGA